MQPHTGHIRFEWGFSPEKCVRCGKCLSGCLYSGLSPQKASEVMRKITEEPCWLPELSPCIRCGKCDHRCPNDARPSSLMRECLAQRRREEPMVPASMAYGINGLGPEGWGPNLFKDVYKGLGGRDREILRSWAVPKKSRDLLWVGCTDRMMPRNLEDSHVLRNAAKFGGPDDCCGVWPLQAGLLDEGYRTVRRLMKRLKENSFERLVVGCGHCQKVFTRLMPEMLGIELPFPVVSIYEYLLELIQSGAARIAEPAALDGAISDPCFGYENGEPYLNAVRSLAAAVGMSLSELPHNRESSLCCGYGALFTGGRIAQVAKTAMIKRRDFASSGKKHMVSYCPGCHLVNHYFQPGYRSHYLLEEALLALGDPVPEPFSIFYRRLARPHIAINLMGTTKSAFF